MLYWWCKYVLLGPVLRLFCRPTIEGVENVPEGGGAILASNHLAVADSFFLPLLVPRRITFLAKREYFTQPGLVGRLKKIFFTGVGQVPIDRSGGSAAQDAMDTGVRLLSAGNVLGIYPEGTRSPDGRLYKGKTGVARMAIVAGVPVIPVAMIDTEKLQPPGTIMPQWLVREPGRRLPRLIRPGVEIGKPLDFSRYEGMERDRFVLRSVTDEIMYALMELSGQEYVDMYADKAKDLIKAGESVDEHLRLGDTKAS